MDYLVSSVLSSVREKVYVAACQEFIQLDFILKLNKTALYIKLHGTYIEI
jgi:hypothetical protein